MENDRINHTSQTAARRGDANSKSDACGEIGAQDSDRGDKETAAAETYGDGLCEHDLPVLGAQRQHHLAEDEQKGAGDEKGAEVAGIVNGAGESADNEEEEGLDATNPRDGRWVRRGEERGFVVGLVRSEGIDYAPDISLAASHRPKKTSYPEYAQ